MEKPPLVPMKVVTRRTGLTAHAIRAWEKRYGAVTPVRSESSRRLYCEEDVQRLILLANLTRGGYNIGSIAQLSRTELQDLAAQLQAPAPHHQANGLPDLTPPPPARPPASSDAVEQLHEAALAATARLDAGALEELLQQATVDLSRPQLVEKLLAPLLEEIGERWQSGELRVAHEHLASTVIRNFLGHLSAAYTVPAEAPVLIVATPAGQLHELGALMAAYTASSQGWRSLYLGPNLPSAEIAAAVRQAKARAVALSIVFPADDPALPAQLRLLRRALPDTPFIAGGRGWPQVADVLEEIGAHTLGDLRSLGQLLGELRH